MSYEDFDIEFEDEEETNRKKNEAIHVDVNLEFGTPEGNKPRPTAVPNVAVGGGASTGLRPPGVPLPTPTPAQSNVRKIEDARSGVPPKVAGKPVSTQARAVGTSAIQEDMAYDLESQQVVELRKQLKQVEFDAQVKVQVAEFKAEILSEMLSDMKLAEHQIGQLLARINAKHPDIKNEALMIKKILADFTAKKRK